MAASDMNTGPRDGAQHGARVVALQLVEALAKAHQRFVAGEPKALHDVRVAVRRLRTWLRAYRSVLDDTVGKASRRAVDKLAGDTAVARETEVSLEMLNELPPPPPRARSGHSDLQQRLTREASRSRGKTDELLADSIPRAVARLMKELSHFRVDVPLDGEPRGVSMAKATAEVIAYHGEKLARALELLADGHRDGAAPDNDVLHSARIRAKRLRYIVERVPLDAARALVSRLTALQDALGDYRDARLLADRAMAEIGRSARNDARARTRALLGKETGAEDRPSATRPRVRAGLLQVARGADARARNAWSNFEGAWPSDERAARLRAEVRGVVDELLDDS